VLPLVVVLANASVFFAQVLDLVEKIGGSSHGDACWLETWHFDGFGKKSNAVRIFGWRRSYFDDSLVCVEVVCGKLLIVRGEFGGWIAGRRSAISRNINKET